MRMWACVAEVIKTKTLEGGLVVQSTTGLSFLLQEGMEIVFVPPKIGYPRSGTVESIRSHKGANYMICVDSINTIDTAEALVGCSILARREELGEIEDSGEQGVVGYLLIDDEHAELGHVIELIHTSAQTLIRVQGDFGELLVPDVPEIVYSTDLDSRIILTRIPKGLLETATKRASSE